MAYPPPPFFTHSGDADASLEHLGEKAVREGYRRRCRRLPLDPVSTPTRRLALAELSLELLEGKSSVVRGGLSGVSEWFGGRIKFP